MNTERLMLLLRLGRFHFLVLGFLIYLLGYLLALFHSSEVNLSTFFAGYFVFGLAHLSVSFSNDYFDRLSDKSSISTPFSGGSRVLVEHPELERLALTIAASLLLSSIIGIAILAIIFDYSCWFVIFGVIGGLTGWFYSAPPLKLAYRGLGEIAAMIAVGFLMPGMGYFVASGFLSLPFLAWVFPLSCYGIFFIITVELLDLESDQAASKLTLVVKWGRKKAKAISLIATLLGTISLVAINLSELANEVYLTPIVFFSLAPLTATIFSFASESQDRRRLTKQVIVNMLSMVVFIVGTNVILLVQI